MSVLAALALATAGSAPAQTATKAAKPEAFEPTVGQAGKDVVWVPTPDAVVERMLDMAQVSRKDHVVDLGSGDGKIAIAAAKRGARARGIEYNPKMVELSRRNAKAAGVRNVAFEQGDIFKADFSKADVITLYLLPQLNERLRPILLDMKPGTRVASHQFDMGDWKPDETANVDGRLAMFWRVPAKVEGAWDVRLAGDSSSEQPMRLRLRQRYQELEGEVEAGNGKAELRDAKLAGADVSFTIAQPDGAVRKFEGKVEDRGRISGVSTAEDGGDRRLFTALRQP